MLNRALDDVARLADQSSFQRRIGIAFKKIAREILLDKENRELTAINYAQTVIRFSYEEFYNLASLIALDENIDIENPTDDQIIKSIKNMWLDVSGIIRTGASLEQLPQEIRLAQAKPLVEASPDQSGDKPEIQVHPTT